MPDVSVLDVLLYSKPIGTLTLIQGDRTLFAFNQSYIDDPDRPTLSLSFKDQFGNLLTDIAPSRIARRSSQTCCRRVLSVTIWQNRRA
jgi:serine/threonine-protein kinase HipA